MATHTLSERLPALLQGVHPGWLPFFVEHGLGDLAREALEKAEPDVGRLAPAEGLIFEFLRYFGPDDAQILIMGQDPYSDGDAAQGVCFSIPHGEPLKESLKSIIGNLERNGLTRPHYLVKDDPSSGLTHSGDLRVWAAQGVLLMNAALTNRAGARGAHRGHWKRFTTAFVRALSARAAAQERQIIFMLWGADARAFAEAVDGPHPVYHWTHPSPLINNRLPEGSRFERAPHFVDANAALRARGLRPVEWDPLAFTYAFTDGSCPRNGKPDAEASFAAFILTGPLKLVEVAGRVAPQDYAFTDPDDPLKGFAPVPGTKTAPTNNRGEYLAWCWVLLLLLRGGVRGRAEVVSDCNLFIQTMEDWLPSRRARGKEAGLKNLDLVLIADRLLRDLRDAVGAGSAGVLLTHVNSHRKRPPPEAGPRAQVLWYGNDRVDQVAGALLEGSEEFTLTTNSPALDWRLHGRFK